VQLIFILLFAITSLKSESNNITDDDFQTILKSIAINNTIAISIVNCGYLAFVDNWIWHAQNIGLTNYLLIADDIESYKHLKSHIPNNVIPSSMVHNHHKNHPDLHHHINLTIVKNTHGFLDFGSENFNEFTCHRPYFISMILHNGYKVWYTDMDTALIKLPWDYFPHDKAYDYVGQFDTDASQQDYVLCTCFIWVIPTPAAKYMIHSWHSQCMNHKADKNDQDVFQDAHKLTINHSTHPLLWTHTDPLYFPTGNQVDKSQTLYDRHPNVWFHANYRLGFENKRFFLIRNNVWLINTSVPDCGRLSTRSLRHINKG